MAACLPPQDVLPAIPIEVEGDRMGIGILRVARKAAVSLALEAKRMGTEAIVAVVDVESCDTRGGRVCIV